MNNNCESFDKQWPVTFWFSRACGLIFFSIGGHQKQYVISAYITAVIIIIVVTYSRISMLLFDGAFEYDVHNKIFNLTDSAYHIAGVVNFYGKIINMYRYKNELKSILVEVGFFEHNNHKSHITHKYFRGFLLTFLTVSHIGLHSTQGPYTFTVYASYNADIVKIPVECTLMYYIFSEVQEEFCYINNTLTSIDLRNREVAMKKVAQCISYHNKLYNLANNLNQILMFNNFSTLLHGLIAIITCAHFASYTIRSHSIFLPCVTTTLLFVMNITFMLQNWMSVKNEVRRAVHKLKVIF